jgi:hypothetical protein
MPVDDEFCLNLLARVEKLETEAQDRDRTIEILRADLDKLAAAPKAKDDLNARILAFLAQFPGVKFSPTSVAENLEADNGRVADRLRTLSAQGKVILHQAEGKHPLYSFPKS